MIKFEGSWILVDLSMCYVLVMYIEVWIDK